MNVLDIDNETLETACSHARVNLMWHARQQTDPQKMVDYALAAAATDLYPAALTDMARNKVLASFELGLSEKARDFLISKEELNRGLLLDLHGFLSDTALAHAREYRSSVFDSLNDGHPTPNFGAVAVNCAEKTAGIDDYEAGRRAGELLKEQESHAADHGGRDAVTVEYETSYGERFKLALYCDTYVDGGGLAVAALDATDPDSEDYMEPWSTLTVNVPDDLTASRWCSTRGNVVIDTNNNSKELVDALVRAGIITLTGGLCFSGFCAYPLATVAPWAMEAMGTHDETVERLTGNRQEEPQQDASRDDGQDYNLASIEREIRSVSEQSHDDAPCPPDGPER